MKKIALIITTYNRSSNTSIFLDGLKEQEGFDKDFSIKLYVHDDGSSDDTVSVIKQKFPTATILHGDGNYFWNRGMANAFTAVKTADFDYILLANDDLIIYPLAIINLLDIIRREGDVVVGSICDSSGLISYGGLKSDKTIHRLAFRLVTNEKNCDTFNANLVLINREIIEKVGFLDRYYQHSLGDIDLGLRISRAGFKIVSTLNFVGSSNRNSKMGTWEDESAPLIIRIKNVFSKKGRPPRDYKRFTKRFGGRGWIIIWIRPYAGILISSVKYFAKNKINGSLRK